jgi:hypothetical protein
MARTTEHLNAPAKGRQGEIEATDPTMWGMVALLLLVIIGSML